MNQTEYIPERLETQWTLERVENMKQKFIWFFLIIIILTSFSCNKPLPRLQQNNTNLSNPSGADSPPLQQQADDSLPWEDKSNFMETINKYDTPILMAKYKATLHEPLPGEMYNVGFAAKKLAGTVVKPGKIFSQNQKLGPYTAAQGYRSGPMYKGTQIVTATGGGVCKIASLLYNVTVLSDLPVIERHCHSMTVPYVPPGQDATVCYGVKDFRFLNNTNGPIVIWAEAIENTLYMAFYGQQEPPQVTWRHETLKEIKYWSIYKQSKKLPQGEEKVIIPGQDGYIVRSWVTVKCPDGTIDTKNRGKSYYNPLPEVIEKGTGKKKEP